MYTITICIILLILGYVLYGGLVEKVFAPDKNKITPAYELADGVDYVEMPTWKIFMIQFLNIAGTGPIFGAIMGAMYGSSCYIWIVVGCIFGGAVHDYLAGMISIRNNGENLPEIIGRYMGNTTKHISLFISVILLLLVGAVFTYSPASILSSLTDSISFMTWVVVILTYYFVATLIPIDKIIGMIYPLFSIVFIFMAFGISICLFKYMPTGIPEIWDGLQNKSTEGHNIFPCLFITIACGAISGFHATQSPIMARCMKNEKHGRPVFYGAMITEGIVAIIWAGVATYFFYGGGNIALNAEGLTDAPKVVTVISESWLGEFGGALALIGVVVAPITSCDTALRGARLIISDAFKIKQNKLLKRLLVAIPIFVIVGLLLWFNISNNEGFEFIWRYFGWANQTLSIFTLYAITIFLMRERKKEWYLITLIPALFMTSVCTTFILTQEIGFGIPEKYSNTIGIIVFALSLIIFYIYKIKKNRKK